jgi:hypothetical protein
LLIENLHSHTFIPLGKRGEPHHVGEHDRGKSPLGIRTLEIHHSGLIPLWKKIEWV